VRSPLGITPYIDRMIRSVSMSISDSMSRSDSRSRRSSSCRSSSSDLLVDVVVVGTGVAMIAMDSFDRV
jgi:hypothetical protein